MTKPVFYFTYSMTVFLPLGYLYPECKLHIEGHELLTQLHCLQETCPRNRNCMDTLARRVKFFFDRVTPGEKLIIAYYKTVTGRIKAGLFYPDLREPRLITCNKSAFRRCKRRGTVYRWDPPAEFYLLKNSTDIVVPEGIISE